MLMLSSFVARGWEVFCLFERLREQARSHRGSHCTQMFRLILAEVVDPRGGGHFSVVATGPVKENPMVLLVETQYLEWADHAE
ncbi:hypothetical protein BK675_03975 [Pseudomonas fluorescens]|nr:hypothetical protein BK677_04010 [Pseudomonas fluorescens]ROO11839.1 hypothetical protein BK675_03975 [Pseudomonas fluorescens]ROO20150.1 hypothetical protein BK676_06005 [Pseudomonas fluorescens]